MEQGHNKILISNDNGHPHDNVSDAKLHNIWGMWVQDSSETGLWGSTEKSKEGSFVHYTYKQEGLANRSSDVEDASMPYLFIH